MGDGDKLTTFLYRKKIKSNGVDTLTGISKCMTSLVFSIHTLLYEEEEFI